MFMKVIVITVLAIFSQHMFKLIYKFDLHKTVYNHQPGKCRIVPGIDYGSEDMETLSNGLTFITSGILMVVSSPTTNRVYRENNVKGRIYLFDFNNPDKNAQELKITGDLNQSDFHPHGMSSWQDQSSGRLVLYVANHGSLYDTVEKFEYNSDQRELRHLFTYKDPTIYNINDVLVVEEDKFYFTNHAYYRHRLGSLMEFLFMLRNGNIMYFDGSKYSIAADGFNFPNGLAVSLNKKYLYMCTGDKDMKILERGKNGDLTLKQVVPLYTMPDNPLVDKATGNILIGAHPLLYKCGENIDDPSKPAASQVLMLHMDKSGSNVTQITELYSDDGHTLYASSVASLYKRQLLIGTVFNRLMYCHVETM